VASWGRARWARPLTLRLLWGKQTDYLLASQPWDYAFGADSALERLLLLDGKIVLLGSDHDAVTFLHYAEHIVDIPGKRVARYQVPVMEISDNYADCSSLFLSSRRVVKSGLQTLAILLWPRSTLRTTTA
jgi:aminoglycoside N3'-acetyltransferase